ncbi:septal ring lytic transglycosylase RlpA family protein [Bacteroidota bacterium]
MYKRILFFIYFTFLIFTISIKAQNSYNKTGIASFYADKFEGRQTANGEIYYHAKRTAAHRTLPFGSVVKVTNLENNKYVVVRINDRGPFVDNRIIDLSKSVAKELDFIGKGLAKVRVELIASTDDLPEKVKTDQKTQTKEYYKVNVDVVTPNGKGVQIGSYKNDENVFRLVEQLKKKYNEQVFIEVATVKKQKVYRIIIGNYNSDAQLEALKQKLSKEFKGCFIVTFKNN